MTRYTWFAYIALIFGAIILAFSGCSDNGTDPPEPPDTTDMPDYSLIITAFEVVGIDAGGVQFSWAADNRADSDSVVYLLMRAAESGIHEVIETVFIDTSFTDVPPYDGLWSYRVTVDHDSAIYIQSENILWGPQSNNFVYIPSGPYTLGADPVLTDEGPPKTIYLTGYWVGKYEVTNAEYCEFFDAGGYYEQSYWLIDDGSSATTDTGWNWVRIINGWDRPRFWDSTSTPPYSGDPYSNLPNSPVVGVSWYEFYAYCSWRGYVFPTEAQWLKAATGPVQRHYPWGDVFDDTKCNSLTGDSYDRPAPVGSFPGGVSYYGCYDMSGNVSEMCRDWYKRNTDWIGSDTINPWYSNPYDFDDNDKLCLGGSYHQEDESLRITRRRDVRDPKHRYSYKGFRMVIEVPQGEI